MIKVGRHFIRLVGGTNAVAVNRLSLATLRFSTVFQVNPQGETLISEYDDQTNQPLRQFTATHINQNISSNDYYRGHLLCDQLEYVNDTIEKIETSVNTLEDLNCKKRSMTSTIGLMNDSNRNEMKKLFEQSTATKLAVKKQILDMKEALKFYKEWSNKKSFAVDAPDGVTDDCHQQEMYEVQKILLNTPTIRQRAATIQEFIRNSRIGVDAPDGTCDAMDEEDLSAIKYILDNSKKCSKSRK